MMTRVHLARDILSMWKKPRYLTIICLTVLTIDL